jgi:hypothetical protein
MYIVLNYQSILSHYKARSFYRVKDTAVDVRVRKALDGNHTLASQPAHCTPTERKPQMPNKQKDT